MKALLILLAVPVCFAQRYAGPGRVVFSNPSGFGNVAHPGTGSAPQANFGLRLGQSPRRSRSYAYPVFVGGSYYGGYGSGGYSDASAYNYAPQGYAPQSQAPVNVTVVNAPPQVPPVIINQNFGPQQPAPELAAADPARAADTSDAPPPRYFLVAFKDHSVYSALTYWIEDKTLHYVTPQQTHNQASLDLIDMDFTNKLNQR